MVRRTASALMIVLACCGIAAAADLELLPKGPSKKRPAERPAQTAPVAPTTPVLPGAAPQTPRQKPAQQPVAPASKPEAPARQAPSQQAPSKEAPSQQAPAQQPSAPQRLQSPERPGDQGKSAPGPVPNPASKPSPATSPATSPVPSPAPKPGAAPSPDDKRLNDLQPPAMPAPTDRESWWQKVVRHAPNCRTFSDGCRTCDATFTCSSLPIACQPKEFVCIDPASPPSSK